MKEQLMANGDTVKMKLTFPRGNQQPGTIVEVPADEVHRWKGFAVPADDPQLPSEAPVDPKPDTKAPVDEWRTYAVSLGMEQARASKATSKELQDWVRDASDKS